MSEPLVPEEFEQEAAAKGKAAAKRVAAPKVFAKAKAVKKTVRTPETAAAAAPKAAAKPKAVKKTAAAAGAGNEAMEPAATVVDLPAECGKPRQKPAQYDLPSLSSNSLSHNHSIELTLAVIPCIPMVQHDKTLMCRLQALSLQS
jgi:hypothetical protein